MSEASSNLEIEDVLSSIRRLVSQSARPSAESGIVEKVPSRPQLLFGGISEASSQALELVPGAEAERLVLTASLRVTEEDSIARENEIAAAEWPGESHWLRSAHDDASHAAEEFTDAGWIGREEDADEESGFVDLTDAEPAAEQTFSDGNVMQIFPAAVRVDIAERHEPQGGYQSSGEENRVTASESGAAPSADEASAESDTAGADEGFDLAVADVPAPIPAAPIATLRSGRRRLHLADRYPAAERTGADPVPADDLSGSEVTPDASVPFDIAAAVSADTAGNEKCLVVEDPDEFDAPRFDAEADAFSAAPLDLDDTAVAVGMGDEALGGLVADVLRRELQGPLGERITRNMRLLVRREIERALATRDIE